MGSGYELHLHAPAYPEKMFPGRCAHDVPFRMVAKVHLPKKARDLLEIDHHVCLACGRPLSATFGGNALVDIQMLLEDPVLGWNPAIGSRLVWLRERWGRLAAKLFNENGWKGRHERISRIIDPNLTMKFVREPGVPMASIRFDPTYLRPDTPAQ